MDVAKALPKVVMIEDPQGKVMEQQVWYEWAPPFCSKCRKVGHKCEETKAKGKAKQPQQNWVVKRPQKVQDVQHVEKEQTNQAENSKVPEVTEEEHHETEIRLNDVSTPAQPNITTPTVTIQTHDDGGEWQNVNKRTRPVTRRPIATDVIHSNTYLALFEEAEEEEEDARPLLERGSPYLT